MKIYDDNPEEAPIEVRNILYSFNEELDGYKECYRIVEELAKIGWYSDYGLDAELFNLRELTTKERLRRLAFAPDNYEFSQDDYNFLDKVYSAMKKPDDDYLLKATDTEQVKYYLGKLFPVYFIKEYFPPGEYTGKHFVIVDKDNMIISCEYMPLKRAKKELIDLHLNIEDHE